MIVMSSVILILLAFLFEIFSGAKSLVKKYEFEMNDRMSYSVFNLYKRYKTTINENYRNELKLAIMYKAISLIFLIIAFLSVFAN